MNGSDLQKLIKLRRKGETYPSLAKKFKNYTANALRKTINRTKKKSNVKVLLLDIETAPMLGYIWGLFDQNVSLNQLKADWHVLSWSAKWLDDPPDKVMYMDQRNEKSIEDDTKILGGIWKLMNEADVIIGQNSKKFDIKKLNARFIEKGFPPPSSYRQIDTLVIAKKHFGFSSNKLEYMTKKLCTKYKKSGHAKFSGFELWKQCLAGNKAAWKEMQEYNKMDVLSLEELYHKLKPWDNTINFNVFNDEEGMLECSCGSTDLKRSGYVYSNSGKYQRYICQKCGKEHKDKENLLSAEKRKSLKK